LGSAAVSAVLGAGETGSATGSALADDLIFGPDMGAAGTSIGRTYLGVPRMVPVAGTNRSLGKLLRRDLATLYGDSWWDAKVHPWVFCSFDKTMTALWAASTGRYVRDAVSVRYRWRHILGAPTLKHYHHQYPPSKSAGKDTTINDPGKCADNDTNDPTKDSRFYLRFPSEAEPMAVARRARHIRTLESMWFVQSELGFKGAVMGAGGDTVVLDAICLRAREAAAVSKRMRRDADVARAAADGLRLEECSDRSGAIDAEARAARLEHLVFVVQLWTDQMLDLAYWMQQNRAVCARRYTDGLDLDRSATMLLYPHGRRFVSMNDMPDLVPWLPYASACQERQYWAPPGGCGGLAVSETHTTARGTPPGKGKHGGNAQKRRHRQEPTATTTTTTGTTALAHMGMPALAHMVLSKSIPQPCTVRNLDQIAIRNATDDPPVGLATMDAMHVVLMGNYVGARERPRFAQRMHIRVGSLVFRGATCREVCGWMAAHYRLLHLAFKIWYIETVDQSPAYRAFISDVQHHREFVRLTRVASDQTRAILGTTLRCDPACPDVTRILDDSAHMNHGESLTAFGKLRKGTFVELVCNRIKNWLRGCGRDPDLPQQYREEIAQMVVLSKIAYSLPEYSAHMVSEIESRRSQEAAEDASVWALGAPLADLPVSVIESFLKWDGDSTMSVSPWFADRSFFLTDPYRWIDEDTLRAIDLAAWMCARRVDGRFVLSWLRYPIGVSAETYQRLINLYFSYECCDVADNIFFVNLRRVLFRRRRRIISATEYDARMARKDPTIVHPHTEVIKQFVPSQTGPPVLRPVFYHILEEFGTAESRRDFAILYEYVNRVVAYQTWAVVPLSRRITEHQIEAVKRRQTIEPWKRTDTELLGSRHLCVCGRWACDVVTPPLRPVTSSVTERRTSLVDHQHPAAPLSGPDLGANGVQSNGDSIVIPDVSSVPVADSPSYNIVPTRRVPSQSMEPKGGGGGGMSITRDGRRGGGDRNMGSVANLDASDLRTVVSSARWAESDYVCRRQSTKGASSASCLGDAVMEEGGLPTKVAVTVHRPVLPEMSEPVTRDVHPSASSRDIGEANLGYDLEHPGRLVSKEHNQAPYCVDQQMYRVNLLGRAVRPKGPKTPSDGPWYTICATCGSLTTVDLGRWNHRGPSCGAHGRPHRLPDRIAPYDPVVDGPSVIERVRTNYGGDAFAIRVPQPRVSKAVREDLARLYADSFLPAPEDVPRCWYDHQPCDVRATASRSQEERAVPEADYGPVSRDPAVRVRYEAGTSVATAVIGSTGAALHARNTTISGTNQAPPVRRMLVRGAVFADLGGSLLVDRTCPIYRRDLALEGGGLQRGCEIRRGVLPAEILPVVGEEMALKVFDDCYRGPVGIMRLRWIYLCPSHMKDLRKGWISSWGRIVQIQKQKEAGRAGRAGDEGAQTMAEWLVLDNAAAGKRVGPQAIVKHLFSRVHRLSDIRRAIERGRRARVRKDIRYGRDLDMPLCPDFAESRRRWSEQH